MVLTPLSDHRRRDSQADSSIVTRLAFVSSAEFRGWACNKCDWRFSVNPNLAFTDAGAERVVTLFDEHHCGEAAKLGSSDAQPWEREATMSKTVTIPDWIAPLVVGIAVVGIVVSLVVAALSTA
jgi:hypothetical protein